MLPIHMYSGEYKPKAGFYSNPYLFFKYNDARAKARYDRFVPQYLKESRRLMEELFPSSNHPFWRLRKFTKPVARLFAQILRSRIIENVDTVRKEDRQRVWINLTRNAINAMAKIVHWMTNDHYYKIKQELEITVYA